MRLGVVVRNLPQRKKCRLDQSPGIIVCFHYFISSAVFRHHRKEVIKIVVGECFHKLHHQLLVFLDESVVCFYIRHS